MKLLRCGVIACVAVIMATTAQAQTQTQTQAQTRAIDDLGNINSWHASASDDVLASLEAGAADGAAALCLNFDFRGVSGYAIARKEVPLDFPADYAVSFNVRGTAPDNALQFKFVDASGENVWWVHRPDFHFTSTAQALRFKKRQIEFAWGPATDHELRRSAAVELVVASGRGGGKGQVCIDTLALHTMAPVKAAALSALQTITEDTGAQHRFTVDPGALREFGGVVLHWMPWQEAHRYTLATSTDGLAWQSVHQATDAHGADQAIYLGETETRFLRVQVEQGSCTRCKLRDVEWLDLAGSSTPNAFFSTLAARARRGQYPRGFSGEQSYWTVLGVQGGSAQALLGEDGALEFAASSAAIEPMLVADGRVLTWADAQISHHLPEGYLPVPTVRWTAGQLRLDITAFATGNAAGAQTLARYTVENTSAHPRKVQLVLAARPFQVNPPTQFLNIAGGVAPLNDVAWDGAALTLNQHARVQPLQTPDAVFAMPFDANNLPGMLHGWQAQRLHGAARVNQIAVHDAQGFANAAMVFDLDLPAHGTRSIHLVTPLGTSTFHAIAHRGENPQRWFDRQQAQATDAWREALNRVRIRLPANASAHGREIVDTMRTALAHVLINRNGPAIQPGTRSYARSWIRDGALTSEALLRLGHENEAREFADWFSARQFTSGKVPCCVDYRGADPVPENDSHGELIHLIHEVQRYAPDDRWLESMWSHVDRATHYMDELRASQGPLRNGDAHRVQYLGLLPASISHEGYSDKPAYSYWDDFWGLTGYKAAVSLAMQLGHTQEATHLAQQRDAFAQALFASIDKVVADHKLDTLPASADRADYDPTSSTIALWPADELARLPLPLVQHTFDRYWREFEVRKTRTDWDTYTPYEWRNLGATVRLGGRERVPAIVDFFFADRRPAGWNQWGEVVARDMRQPRFIGDMPHGWVASDFIRAALDLFAYERGADAALVLAAGVQSDWLDNGGMAIHALRTPFGQLSYTLGRERGRVVLDVRTGLHLPAGGLVLRLDGLTASRSGKLNGERITASGDELRVLRLPAHLEMDHE